MINKLTVILFLFSFLPLEAEPYFPQEKTGMCTWPVFRIQFQEDDYSGTTGNGRFLADEWIGHDTVYTIDALPHDLDYFRSHLQFIHHYWNSVSEERLSVDTSSSLFIAPATLSHSMNYYAHRDSLDYRLASMIHETVKAAVDSGNNIPLNDGIIIYHAGVGQDFDIDLDESPFDIPSFYFDEVYLSDYLPADKLDYLQI